MIEILNILLTVITFLTLSFFSNIFFSYNKNNLKNLDIIDISGKNFLIFLNIILFTSLFNPNKQIIFFLCLLISILSILIIFSNYKKTENKFFFLILIFFTIIISIDISNNFEYTWDVKKYYLHKVTGFYQNFFIDDFVKKTEYPHFGTYIWSFFWKNNLINHEYTGRLIYGFIYVLSIFYFINSFIVSKNTKILISLLLIILTYKTNLFDGKPDILVFSFFLFLAKYLLEIFHKNIVNLTNILFIVLTLNLLLWTKSEGIAYVILISLTLLLFMQKNFNYKIIFLILVLFVITIKYITYYYYGISFNPNVETFDIKILKSINFDFVFSRSMQIITWYLIYFFTNPIIILSLLSLIIIQTRYNNLLIKFNYLYFFLFTKFCTLFVTYFVTVYPMPFHIKYSLDRIIFHSSGLFIVIIYYCILNILKDKKKINY